MVLSLFRGPFRLEISRGLKTHNGRIWLILDVKPEKKPTSKAGSVNPFSNLLELHEALTRNQVPPPPFKSQGGETR
jgi:hypothetical protein